MEMSMKKSRQGRANARQINAMIDYMEKYPHVATNKFIGLHGKENIDGSWEEMANHLNSLATDSKVKDVKSWKTTWRDHKTKVSDKMKKIRKNRAETGNNSIEVTLTEFDKRVLGIMGHEYVTGNDNCPDSFPEEYSNAMEELVQGNSIILDSTPTSLNVYDEVNEQYLDVEYLQEQMPSHVVEDIAGTSADPQDRALSVVQEEGRKEDFNKTVPHLRNKQITATTKPNRIRQDRLGVQFANARESFTEIGEKHANAMEMLAGAMQVQADAMKMQAEATKMQAEASLRVAEAMEKVAENSIQQTKLMKTIMNHVKH